MAVQLYDWQRPYAAKMKAILQTGNVVLCASEAGTGKTYMAIDTAKQLGLKLFVSCPKAAITSWRRVALAMNFHDVVDIVNPERITLKLTPWFASGKWLLPKGTLVVLDEVHRGASGIKSHQAFAFGLLRAYPDLKIALLSATPADSPLKMRFLGYVAGLHQFNTSSFYDFCRAHACKKSRWHNGYEFSKGQAGKDAMLKIYQKLAPIMVRALIDSIPDFPEDTTTAQLVTTSEEDLVKVNDLYKRVQDRVAGYVQGNVLVEQSAARQLSEVLKVPWLVAETIDRVAEGKSVVIFLCFHESMDGIEAGLRQAGIECRLIDSRHKDRQNDIDAFQADKVPVMLAQVQTGGVSISLHADRPESRQRFGYLCPSYSVSELVQCHGRIWRSGGYHRSIQQVVLLAGSIEERIYDVLQRKQGNLTALVDGDLSAQP